MACSGTSPTSSDPVTRSPRSVARATTSSKATCTGVTEMFVRFIEIWAIPYSSMYQPMPLTHFSEPGIQTGFPSASLTTGPVSGSPSRFWRPFSRTSKATAFARRLEVVLRLML